MESFAESPSGTGENNPFPLCTSANMSGDTDGPIIEQAKALSFAKERHIPLFIHTDLMGSEKGSYPIIEELAEGQLRLARNGPQGEEILHKLRQLL